MFFLQIAQVPVTVRLADDRELVMDKMVMDEIIAYGKDLMEQRVEEATRDMEEFKRREYLTFYPPIPPDLREMKAIFKTGLGAKYVFMTQAMKGKVFKLIFEENKDEKTKKDRPRNLVRKEPLPSLTEQEVESLIVANGTGKISQLAWILADVDEMLPYKSETIKGDNNSDPLPNTGTPGSNASATTGQTKLPSGKLPTPASH